MQDSSNQAIYRSQKSSQSPVQSLLSKITLKMVLCYGAAALFFAGFFIVVHPQTSPITYMFIEIALFFTGIILQALFTLLTIRNRRMRELQAQTENGAGVSKWSLTLSDTLVGVFCLASAAVVFVGQLYSSNPLIIGIVESYILGSTIALLIYRAHVVQRDEPALVSSAYRDKQGNFD